MRLVAYRVMMVGLLMAAAPAGAQPSAGGYSIYADSQIQVAANEWALTGHAEVTQGDTSLYADEIDYFTDENHAIASGNVLLSQGANRIGADSADFNTKTRLGVFHHAYGIASMKAPRPAALTPGALAPPPLAGQETDIYFFGDVLEKIGPKKYKITNGGFTTCLQPTPRWNLHAGTIVVNVNHYTMLTQAVLKVKGVPLLYLPFMYYPTKEENRATGFLLPSYSSNSVMGQSIHNAFFWAIDRSQDLTVQHEWFSKAGQGLGGEYRYNWGGGSDGRIQAFVLNAHTDPASALPSERSFNIQGSANQGLPGRLRARMSASYFSSLTTNQIFNADVLTASNNMRQYTGNVVGAWRMYSLNATVDRREFFYNSTDSTVTGSTPKITVSRNERPLFAGSQLYFSMGSEYGFLKNETKNSVETVDKSVNRFDVSPQLRYPFKKWQFFTVSSSIAWRDTFYSRSLSPTDPNTVVGDSLNRQFFTLSADATGPSFTRIFDTPGNGYAQRFKHTIEPKFTVTRVTGIPDAAQPQSFVNPNGRIIVTDSVDYAIGGTTNLRYGVNNHLYAKRKIGQTTQTPEILRVSVFQTYYTQKNASQYDVSYQTGTSVAPSHFSPVSLDVQGMPSTSVNGNLHADFDSRTRDLLRLSLTGSYNWTAHMQTSAGWSRFYSQDPATNVRSLGSDSLNISASAQTTDNRFGGRYSMLYDLFNSKTQQQAFSGFYNAQCCGVAASYSTRPIFTGQNNNTFTISVTLAGLGSVSPFNGGMNGLPR